MRSSRNREPSALHDVVVGLAAGAVGSAVMSRAQSLVTRTSRRDNAGDTQPRTDEERWQQAPAPAQVVRKASLATTERDIDPERIPQLATTVHWLYGTSWGIGFALLHRRLRRSPKLEGPAFGVGLWALSYAELVPAGIYKPPWRYPASALAKDLSYHLAYGAATAFAFAGLRKAH
jgi:hypothetical protein